MIAKAFILSLLVASACADIYMHNPSGSNNRLNEQNAERNNGNRMFDSQNNNRGGYNIGDKTEDAATTTTNVDSPANTYDETQITTAQQYQMVYYEGSMLQIEWTNQHGCGGNEANDPNIVNCNVVLQYTCDTSVAQTDPALTVKLRDGTTTNQVAEDDDTNPDETTGLHESAQSYRECRNRERNRGLFTADQNLNGNTAIYTRQNPNNNRRGLECPEERDYYPYWLPTIWRDIAYITDHTELCSYIIAESQNTKLKSRCTSATYSPTALSSNDVDTCIANNGNWMSTSFNIPSPVCIQGDYMRPNHLGNARNAQQLNYNWTLPSWSLLTSQNDLRVYDSEYVKCVLRIRYNISTDDYDPWNTNATVNGNASPVRNNPTVDVGADLQGLRLAMNTNQFGRTFEDRSHTFFIRKRPAALEGKKIWNLNVRGKRGNIVQTFPSTEYDFVPNRLHVTPADFVHIQWTGSNTHDNNPDNDGAGDGQGGDAGEGRGGTDRHNFVQLRALDENFPLPLDKNPFNVFAQSKCFKLDGTEITKPSGVQTSTNVNCALWLATSGYFRDVTAVTGATGGGDTLSPTLDNAPPSLVGGVIMQFTTPGQVNYTCTRNNSFSNRSQKGVLIIDPAPAPAA